MSNSVLKLPIHRWPASTLPQ